MEKTVPYFWQVTILISQNNSAQGFWAGQKCYKRKYKLELK